MFGFLQLGRVLGIPVRLHWVLLIVILLFASGSHDPLRSLIWLLVLIAAVLLHEFGHCVVARRFGARVHDITLWPIGGMARMSEIPENTRAEASIALAGPLANLALSAGTLLLLGCAWLATPDAWWSGWSLTAWGLPRPDPPAFGGLARAETLGVVLGSNLIQTGWVFFAMNLALGTFNLLPAFPMDGGRVLRAWLGRHGDTLGATERAVRVGRWIAVAMVVSALLVDSSLSFITLIIAVFIWLAGMRELWSVRLRHGQVPFAFGGGRSPFGAFGTEAFRRGAGSPFGFAGPSGPGGNGNGFGRAQPPFDGVEPYEEERRAREARPVDDLSAGARRPAGTPAPRRSGHGFSDEELRALERFPGRLRRPEADA